MLISLEEEECYFCFAFYVFECFSCFTVLWNFVKRLVLWGTGDGFLQLQGLGCSVPFWGWLPLKLGVHRGTGVLTHSHIIVSIVFSFIRTLIHQEGRNVLPHPRSTSLRDTARSTGLKAPWKLRLSQYEPLFRHHKTHRKATGNQQKSLAIYRPWNCSRTFGSAACELGTRLIPSEDQVLLCEVRLGHANRNTIVLLGFAYWLFFILGLTKAPFGKYVLFFGGS